MEPKAHCVEDPKSGEEYARADIAVFCRAALLPPCDRYAADSSPRAAGRIPNGQRERQFACGSKLRLPNGNPGDLTCREFMAAGTKLAITAGDRLATRVPVANKPCRSG